MSSLDLLCNKLETRQALVVVIGLGYVGLPLAVEFAAAGFAVIGLDVDESKVDAVNDGRSYIKDVSSDRVKILVEGHKLRATLRHESLAEADVAIICVPTPLSKTKEPDISYILAAAESVKRYLHPGQLILLESTTYPGTTDEVLLPLFEETGLKLDKDFFLAFSPERVDPGNTKFHTSNIPKVVGGVSALSTKVAATAYRQVIEQVHEVSSSKVAETAKLLENTFRSVNIGLVNEIACLCHTLGIDVWEVVDAAATKPFGFMPFYPGPGIGGHCIPLDPLYLSWKGRMHGFEARFIGLADEINSRMPDYVVDLVNDGLNAHRKPVNGSKILVIGVAYKRDIDDVRESPALAIIKKLQSKGAVVAYSDPYVDKRVLEEELGIQIENVALDKTVLKYSDAVVIVTDHSCFDYDFIVENASLVIDTRNCTRNVKAAEKKIIRL
ncbi:MAG: nucleotide sugar dehydrogenase [Acidobacteriota bacterium]|nr:nucleotide sugar dehydrogenase [Blastocatellia bacterium]MDW8411457.1 nucleotide sugar dehydrogenase [Acidobacteriota bacterium]